MVYQYVHCGKLLHEVAPRRVAATVGMVLPSFE